MAETPHELWAGHTGQKSWRDRLRNLMQLKYGERGSRTAENLLGASEEEQYMRYLQKKYGTEIPEDVETSRPVSQALLNPSDIGGMDLVLMALSGGRAPFLSSAAAGTETTALLGDALGEYQEGNMAGAGIMGGLATLPYGLRIASPLLKQKQTTKDPLPLNQSKRKFVKGLGVGVAGLGQMASPLGKLSLMNKRGKITKKIDVAPFKKIIPNEALTSSHKDVFGLNKYLQHSAGAEARFLPENTPERIWQENLKNVKAIDSSWNTNPNALIKKGLRKDVVDEAYAMEVMGKEHFSKYGLTPDDINMVSSENVYNLGGKDTFKNLDEFYNFGEKVQKVKGKTIKLKTIENPAGHQSVKLMEIDEVPVVRYSNTGYMDTVYFVPNEQGLAKLAQ